MDTRQMDDMEDLLGGRILAWLGGLAVAAGLFLLLGIAIANGWLGEAARTGMAGVASVALLLIGARLHERRGRTDAASVAAATGIAGLFGTLVVAGAVYHLLPALLALAASLAVGAAATGLALRWRAPAIGALGIVGALLSPALVGALPSAAGVAMLAVATASATAVLLWQRWNWLAFAAFAIATPQWLIWLLQMDRGVAATVATLVAFGALNVVAAIGFELRSRAPRLRISSAALLTLNALVLAGAGWYLVAGAVSHAAANGWLAALAVAHLALGLLADRGRRVSHELALAALALGITLADVAIASTLDGLPVLLTWTVTAAGFAAMLRGTGARRGDEPLAFAGLGGHLLLALGHALVDDAPPHGLLHGATSMAGLLAVAVVGAGCSVSGRLSATGRPWLRRALDGMGLAALAYLTFAALDGPALVAALAAEAVALGGLASRSRDATAAGGAACFWGLGAMTALVTVATPLALVDGLDVALAPALELGALAIAAVVLAHRAGDARGGELRSAALAVAALTMLHLASTELVTAAATREQGQALLSGLWALTGVAVLVAGLLRDQPALRRAALALLLTTVGKVAVYDLASLTSIYRVASLVALGGLLLCGAFAWQRVRPRPPADLRAMPQALR